VNNFEKLCPACNNKNDAAALICIHCGASLDENAVATERVSEPVHNLPLENIHSFVDTRLIPESGVGIYVAGSFMPYYLQIEKELVIGRQVGMASEPMLDLSEQDAFHMGVSRRHAMIQRTETGFEVLDLSSRNGTWLNAEKLIPDKPYPFASGSQIRVGQLRLFVFYHQLSRKVLK
jgi:hypothetical protein